MSVIADKSASSAGRMTTVGGMMSLSLLAFGNDRIHTRSPLAQLRSHRGGGPVRLQRRRVDVEVQPLVPRGIKIRIRRVALYSDRHPPRRQLRLQLGDTLRFLRSQI